MALTIHSRHQRLIDGEEEFEVEEIINERLLQTKKAVSSQMARIPRLRQYLGIRKGLTLPRTPGRVPTLERVTQKLYKPLQNESFEVPIFGYQPSSPRLSNTFSSLSTPTHMPAQL